MNNYRFKIQDSDEYKNLISSLNYDINNLKIEYYELLKDKNEKGKEIRKYVSEYYDDVNKENSMRWDISKKISKDFKIKYGILALVTGSITAFSPVIINLDINNLHSLIPFIIVYSVNIGICSNSIVELAHNSDIKIRYSSKFEKYLKNKKYSKLRKNYNELERNIDFLNDTISECTMEKNEIESSIEITSKAIAEKERFKQNVTYFVQNYDRITPLEKMIYSNERERKKHLTKVLKK